MKFAVKMDINRALGLLLDAWDIFQKKLVYYLKKKLWQVSELYGMILKNEIELLLQEF